MASRLVLQEPHGQLQVQEYTPLKPSGTQIQVRNKATALNQLDWKRIAKNLFIISFPHVLGMDIAGVVEDSGSSTKFAVGDHVIAPGVVGCSDSCSFQTHVLVETENCAKIHKDIPLPEASTVPFCLATAACGLYLGLSLNMIPKDAASTNSKTIILIWGANGSVGKLAIQLAKLSGYTVIAVTSSQTRIAEATLRGADLALGNDDAELISKIKSAAPNLQYAFDTVVTGETIGKIARCVSKTGKIATAIKYVGESPKGCEVNSVFSGEVFGTTTMGAESVRGKEIGQWLWANVSEWLQSGTVTPLESEMIGALGDVQRGLDMMREGKAKKKLVAGISK